MRPLALALLVAAPWHARAYGNGQCPGACAPCPEPAASGATQCASWNPGGILNSDGSLAYDYACAKDAPFPQSQFLEFVWDPFTAVESDQCCYDWADRANHADC